MDTYSVPNHTIVGKTGINGSNYLQVLDYIDHSIAKQHKTYIAVVSAHGVVEANMDSQFALAINRAGLRVPDGMPLVWLARLYGKGQVSRVYGPQLTVKVAELAAKKSYKLYVLGGLPGHAQALVTSLQESYPNLMVVGCRETIHRPLTVAESKTVIASINQSQADIVLVGMGAPYQELWMATHRNQLIPSVLIGVGAAFTIVPGIQRQAPGWIQSVGLEWLFRLWQEPGRLWPRYGRVVPIFMLLVVKQVWNDVCRWVYRQRKNHGYYS